MIRKAYTPIYILEYPKRFKRQKRNKRRGDKVVNVEEVEMDEKDYEEMLNDVYGEIKIGNLTFWAGEIVKELDPIAFRCGLSEDVKFKCGKCREIYEDEEDAKNCCEESE